MTMIIIRIIEVGIIITFLKTVIMVILTTDYMRIKEVIFDLQQGTYVRR